MPVATKPLKNCETHQAAKRTEPTISCIFMPQYSTMRLMPSNLYLNVNRSPQLSDRSCYTHLHDLHPFRRKIMLGEVMSLYAIYSDA